MNSEARPKRRAAMRAALGGRVFVAPTRAAEMLPLGHAAGVRWLRARGLVRVIAVPEEDGTERAVEVVYVPEVEAEILGVRDRLAAALLTPGAKPERPQGERPAAPKAGPEGADDLSGWRSGGTVAFLDPRK